MRLPVPKSSSHNTKTTMPEKMPPISDGIERLRCAWAKAQTAMFRAGARRESAAVARAFFKLRFTNLVS